MSSVSPSTDNVTLQHERTIQKAADYVDALREQWWNLSRTDRQEARRVIEDMLISLHTLGIRPGGTR